MRTIREWHVAVMRLKGLLWKVGCDEFRLTDDNAVGSRAAKCSGRSVVGTYSLGWRSFVGQTGEAGSANGAPLLHEDALWILS